MGGRSPATWAPTPRVLSLSLIDAVSTSPSSRNGDHKTSKPTHARNRPLCSAPPSLSSTSSPPSSGLRAVRPSAAHRSAPCPSAASRPLFLRPATTAPSRMQEAPLAAAEPARRLAQHHHHHQFAGVDLRRPKGYASAAAPAQPEAKVAAAAVVVVVGGGEGGDPCPRCASRETKFCYYNNYNTAQPRHFCKGCRRYWTKGGTLRNVPVGGGTRKKPSSSSSSPLSSYATAGAADADSSGRPAKKKPASNKKRRVVAPAPVQPGPVAAGAANVPIAAADDDAKETTTTTTTDGASEVTTETGSAAAAEAAVPTAAVALEEESLAHLLLQPGSGADDTAVALGLGFSDFASAGKAEVDGGDDSFEWPAAFNLEDTCWASATAGGSVVDQDPALLFLNLP